MRHRIRAGLAVFTLITFVLILQSFQPSRADSGDALAATYSHGSLRVTIPYRAQRAGAGQLRVEILDPEDHVLARSERRVEIAGGKGSWHDDLKLVKALAVDDLVWHRVRYRFAFDDKPCDVIEGAESISEILRMPVLHIVGQKKYLAGGQAGVRVVVTDSRNAAIGEPGTVRIELQSPGAPPRTLFLGRLNQRGTAEAQFRMPDGLMGQHTLRYVADTPIGSAEYSQQVQVEDQTGILLTTEKPIYQPGQTVHVRALALNRARHEASAGRALTFELEDSRGNKVWKSRTQTDQFGIASAQFTLASISMLSCRA